MIFNAYKDYVSLAQAVTDLIADYITIQKGKKRILVCLASGHTPVGVFQNLVYKVNSGILSISNCFFVGLDEWIGIGADTDGSCRHMLNTDLFFPLNIPSEKIIFFDGLTSDPVAEVNRINSFIEDNGGLDIMLVGVGLNGHIAMNEPGTPFESYGHVSELAEETKLTGQKYFSQSTKLEKGMTLGLRHFRESKLPILMANGRKKKDIVSRILNSSSDPSLPASIIHEIPHAHFTVDLESC